MRSVLCADLHCCERDDRRCFAVTLPIDLCFTPYTTRCSCFFPFQLVPYRYLLLFVLLHCRVGASQLHAFSFVTNPLFC